MIFFYDYVYYCCIIGLSTIKAETEKHGTYIFFKNCSTIESLSKPTSSGYASY